MTRSSQERRSQTKTQGARGTDNPIRQSKCENGYLSAEGAVSAETSSPRTTSSIARRATCPCASSAWGTASSVWAAVRLGVVWHKAAATAARLDGARVVSDQYRVRLYWAKSDNYHWYKSMYIGLDDAATTRALCAASTRTARPTWSSKPSRIPTCAPAPAESEDKAELVPFLDAALLAMTFWLLGSHKHCVLPQTFCDQNRLLRAPLPRGTRYRWLRRLGYDARVGPLDDQRVPPVSVRGRVE